MAGPEPAVLDVCYRHLADMTYCAAHVCFRGVKRTWQSLARVGHFHAEDFAQAAPPNGGEADSA